MQAAANQVRWVPIGEIVEPWEESAEGEPDGAVVLSQRPDGRYTLVSGLNTLRRMRDAGQVFKEMKYRLRFQMFQYTGHDDRSFLSVIRRRQSGSFSKSSAPCLHSGQMKSAGSVSPS